MQAAFVTLDFNKKQVIWEGIAGLLIHTSLMIIFKTYVVPFLCDYIQ